MSLNALQGATLIATHASCTKIFLSFTLRTYQYLETDASRREKVESNKYLQQFHKAQLNESEYAALLVAPLLYLAVIGADASQASTIATVGQIGYVWARTFLGYPTLPTITFALVRYGGLALIVAALWNQAF